MKVTLPNGLLDGQDLFNIAIIDELKGKQQNYLANRELVIGNIGHVPKILEDLIVSLETKEGIQWKGNLKEAIWKIPVCDIQTLLVKIRENTYGPKYYFEAECTHCGHLNKDQRLDLDKLKTKKMSIKNMVDDSKRTITLPKSKKEVVLRPMYLEDIFTGIKIAIEHKDKIITSAIALSVKSIDGKENITGEDIEDLPALDLIDLQNQLDKIQLEGDIDTNVEMTCGSCDQDFELQLNVYDSDFFDPTRGYKSTST